MSANQNLLIKNIEFLQGILNHDSDLNPNAPVFVPRWFQPPLVVRQNGTIWTQTNDVVDNPRVSRQ